MVPSNLRSLWNLKQKTTVSLIVHYYIPLTQDKEYLIIPIASALGMGPLHLDKVPINSSISACSGCGSGFICSEKINFILSEEFNYRKRLAKCSQSIQLQYKPCRSGHLCSCAGSPETLTLLQSHLGFK